MTRRTLIPGNLSFQPRPAYPYSPGTLGGGFIYTAGQVAWGPDGEIVGIGDVEAQTRQTLSNVESVLREGGADWSDVLKCNVYLKDMKEFQKMNKVFAEIFPDDPPARTTVQTPLAEDHMLVEIEAVAYVG